MANKIESNPDVFTIKRGATLPVLRVGITGRDGLPLDLTDYTVKFVIATTGQAPILNIEATKGETRGEAAYFWKDGDTLVPTGDYHLEILVFDRDGALLKLPRKGFLKVHVGASITPETPAP